MKHKKQPLEELKRIGEERFFKKKEESMIWAAEEVVKQTQEQLEEAIYQMNRLDRQLVAIADTLRTLHRRT